MSILCTIFGHRWQPSKSRELHTYYCPWCKSYGVTTDYLLNIIQEYEEILHDLGVLHKDNPKTGGKGKRLPDGWRVIDSDADKA